MRKPRTGAKYYFRASLGFKSVGLQPAFRLTFKERPSAKRKDACEQGTFKKVKSKKSPNPNPNLKYYKNTNYTNCVWYCISY